MMMMMKLARPRPPKCVHYKNKQENSCSIGKLEKKKTKTATTAKRTLEKREWHHRQVESPALRSESLDSTSSWQKSWKLTIKDPFSFLNIAWRYSPCAGASCKFSANFFTNTSLALFFLCFFSHVSHVGIGSGGASLRRRRITRLLGWGAIAAGLQPFSPPAAAAAAGVSPMPFLLLLRAALL